MKIFSKLLFFILLISGISLSQTKEITLEALFLKPEFASKSINEFRSLNSGKEFTRIDEDLSIKVYDYETESEIRTLLDGNLFKKEINKEKPSISNYVLSNDESKILITTDIERIYRNSFVANYYVWDIAKKELTLLTKTAKATLAEFSPDAKKVAYVSQNNLFVYDLINNNIEQITTDGKKNFIINGTSDWVYEEELGLTKAFDWSSDSKNIAYMKFDESNLKEMNLTFYGDLYPSEFTYKYPKAGEDNSIVTVWIYNLSSKNTQSVDVGSNTNQYIPRIKFTPDANILSVFRLDRLQKKMEILYAYLETGLTLNVYSEENKYYLSESRDFKFLSDGRFLRLSDMDGYAHIYLHSKDGNIERQLTKGNYEVSEIKGIDEETGLVYYVASEKSPITKDVFSINLNGTNKKKISEFEGSNNVTFSSKFNYYILNYSSANTPSTYSLYRKDGSLVKVLNDNKSLKEKMKEFGFVNKEFFQFNTTDGTSLNGYIMKPQNFEEKKKYPVLMYVYGGPGSQSVMNSYGGLEYGWSQLLCQKGYIIACVDGRGTGARGTEFEKQVYGQMGKFELQDQIEGTKYLASLKYVDKNRIGIWGWSFGGYMSALCITKGADYFKTAVAVAPVTNFRYYDNIYTERYLGLPQDNQKGYDENSPITFADKLKGNLLLVHGSTDDNVHLQNTMDLVNALIKANKQFEMQIYPNRNHNISGGNSRYHLFKRITDYVLKNL